VTNLHKEGIRQAKEALEIYERLGDTVEQARCLINLALSLHHDNQLDAAQGAASRAIGLFSEKGESFQICRCHRILGAIHHSKGETGTAIHHFEEALRIASSSNWFNQLVWIRFSLTLLFSDGGRFDDASLPVARGQGP
jgi:tetratricopeptide (TPR) repeat protein